MPAPVTHVVSTAKGSVAFVYVETVADAGTVLVEETRGTIDCRAGFLSYDNNAIEAK